MIEEVSDVAGARDSGKVAAELVVGEEPEDTVGADGTAGGDSPLLAIVCRGDGDSGHGTVGLQLRELREWIASAPGIVAIEQEGVAVQMVGAAAGDSVDDTAGGAAIFGGVVRGVDLKLAHRRLTGEVGGAGTAALLGEEGLVVVCAIEGVVVEKNADAAKAELAIALLVRRDRGGEQREVGPPAAVRGQLIDGGLVDVGGECGRAQVNDGSGLADFDRLLGMRDGEVRGQRSEAAHLYRDACDVETGEAGLSNPRFIVAGRQAEKAEVAPSVSACLIDVGGVGAGEIDFRVGQWDAIGTDDRTADDALRGRLGPKR